MDSFIPQPPSQPYPDHLPKSRPGVRYVRRSSLPISVGSQWRSPAAPRRINSSGTVSQKRPTTATSNLARHTAKSRARAAFLEGERAKFDEIFPPLSKAAPAQQDKNQGPSHETRPHSLKIKDNNQSLSTNNVTTTKPTRSYSEVTRGAPIRVVMPRLPSGPDTDTSSDVETRFPKRPSYSKMVQQKSVTKVRESSTTPPKEPCSTAISQPERPSITETQQPSAHPRMVQQPLPHPGIVQDQTTNPAMEQMTSPSTGQPQKLPYPPVVVQQQHQVGNAVVQASTHPPPPPVMGCAVTHQPYYTTIMVQQDGQQRPCLVPVIPPQTYSAVVQNQCCNPQVPTPPLPTTPLKRRWRAYQGEDFETLLARRKEEYARAYEEKQKLLKVVDEMRTRAKRERRFISSHPELVKQFTLRERADLEEAKAAEWRYDAKREHKILTIHLEDLAYNKAQIMALLDQQKREKEEAENEAIKEMETLSKHEEIIVERTMAVVREMLDAENPSDENDGQDEEKEDEEEEEEEEIEGGKEEPGEDEGGGQVDEKKEEEIDTEVEVQEEENENKGGDNEQENDVDLSSGVQDPPPPPTSGPTHQDTDDGGPCDTSNDEEKVEGSREEEGDNCTDHEAIIQKLALRLDTIADGMELKVLAGLAKMKRLLELESANNGRENSELRTMLADCMHVINIEQELRMDYKNEEEDDEEEEERKQEKENEPEKKDVKESRNEKEEEEEEGEKVEDREEAENGEEVEKEKMEKEKVGEEDDSEVDSESTLSVFGDESHLADIPDNELTPDNGGEKEESDDDVPILPAYTSTSISISSKESRSAIKALRREWTRESLDRIEEQGDNLEDELAVNGRNLDKTENHSSESQRERKKVSFELDKPKPKKQKKKSCTHYARMSGKDLGELVSSALVSEILSYTATNSCTTGNSLNEVPESSNEQCIVALKYFSVVAAEEEETDLKPVFTGASGNKTTVSFTIKGEVLLSPPETEPMPHCGSPCVVSARTRPSTAAVRKKERELVVKAGFPRSRRRKGNRPKTTDQLPGSTNQQRTKDRVQPTELSCGQTKQTPLAQTSSTERPEEELEAELILRPPKAESISPDDHPLKPSKYKTKFSKEGTKEESPELPGSSEDNDSNTREVTLKPDRPEDGSEDVSQNIDSTSSTEEVVENTPVTPYYYHTNTPSNLGKLPLLATQMTGLPYDPTSGDPVNTLPQSAEEETTVGGVTTEICPPPASDEGGNEGGEEDEEKGEEEKSGTGETMNTALVDPTAAELTAERVENDTEKVREDIGAEEALSVNPVDSTSPERDDQTIATPDIEDTADDVIAATIASDLTSVEQEKVEAIDGNDQSRAGGVPATTTSDNPTDGVDPSQAVSGDEVERDGEEAREVTAVNDDDSNSTGKEEIQATDIQNDTTVDPTLSMDGVRNEKEVNDQDIEAEPASSTAAFASTLTRKGGEGEKEAEGESLSVNSTPLESDTPEMKDDAVEDITVTRNDDLVKTVEDQKKQSKTKPTNEQYESTEEPPTTIKDIISTSSSVQEEDSNKQTSKSLAGFRSCDLREATGSSDKDKKLKLYRNKSGPPKIRPGLLQQPLLPSRPKITLTKSGTRGISSGPMKATSRVTALSQLNSEPGVGGGESERELSVMDGSRSRSSPAVVAVSQELMSGTPADHKTDDNQTITSVTSSNYEGNGDTKKTKSQNFEAIPSPVIAECAGRLARSIITEALLELEGSCTMPAANSDKDDNNTSAAVDITGSDSSMIVYLKTSGTTNQPPSPDKFTDEETMNQPLATQQFQLEHTTYREQEAIPANCTETVSKTGTSRAEPPPIQPSLNDEAAAGSADKLLSNTTSERGGENNGHKTSAMLLSDFRKSLASFRRCDLVDAVGNERNQKREVLKRTQSRPAVIPSNNSRVPLLPHRSSSLMKIGAKGGSGLIRTRSLSSINQDTPIIDIRGRERRVEVEKLGTSSRRSLGSQSSLNQCGNTTLSNVPESTVCGRQSSGATLSRRGSVPSLNTQPLLPLYKPKSLQTISTAPDTHSDSHRMRKSHSERISTVPKLPKL